MSGSSDRSPDSGLGELLEPELAAAARRVDDAWDVEAGHRALLELCFDVRRQAQVARWYRKQSDEPSRREFAHRQLGRLATLALLQLDVERARRPEGSSKNSIKLARYFVFLVLLVGAVTLLTML